MRLRLFQSGDARRAAELARLAHLKETARTCRTEHADASQQEERTGVTPSLSSVAARKKRVQDAEGRYAVAVQAWDNKQWRLKGH